MLSDDKINHISHVLLEGLKEKGLIVLEEDESAVRREIKRTIYGYLKINDEIDGVVKRKINSLSRSVVEGSAEWDILYKKYFEEEENKKGKL